MSFLNKVDEKQDAKKEYNALKKHLGEILLEHNAKEENPEDWAYFSRKFEEARQKLKRTI
jgi:Zn-dependent oligopeptidase